MLQYTITFNWRTKQDNYGFHLYLNIFCLHKTRFRDFFFYIKAAVTQGNPKVVLRELKRFLFPESITFN